MSSFGYGMGAVVVALLLLLAGPAIVSSIRRAGTLASGGKMLVGIAAGAAVLTLSGILWAVYGLGVALAGLIFLGAAVMAFLKKGGNVPKYVAGVALLCLGLMGTGFFPFIQGVQGKVNEGANNFLAPSPTQPGDGKQATPGGHLAGIAPAPMNLENQLSSARSHGKVLRFEVKITQTAEGYTFLDGRTAEEPRACFEVDNSQFINWEPAPGSPFRVTWAEDRAGPWYFQRDRPSKQAPLWCFQALGLKEGHSAVIVVTVSPRT